MEREEGLHFEVGFCRSRVHGEDSCSSDLLGKEKGRGQAGQGRKESKADRNVVSAGEFLQPDPAGGSRAWTAPQS